jgi:hypothetical protein
MQAGPAKANELFTRLAETSDGAVKTREKLFTELKGELELHVSLEERHLFPLLRKHPETKELVADAIRDNKELRAKLNELEAMPKNDPAFAEVLADLQKTFRQHARDDKKELLPAVQRALSDEQMQGVTEKMEARLAEAEQAKQDEAEQRRAKARQEREEAEFVAQQAEAVEREKAATEEMARESARIVADATFRPAALAAKAVADVTRAASGADAGPRAQGQVSALTSMFMWPWMSMAPHAQRPGAAVAARGPVALEEVIPLGEEVLEVGKRTENRGTASIRRFVVETPVERQVTLVSERVVIERRRPASDQVTGEVLTDVAIEVIETEEVPTVVKRLRVREEVVVRMERTQRVETVKETLRRDEVEVQQPGRKRGSAQPRPVAAGA